MNKSLPLPLIAAAAIVAVAFWSFKPIFISLVGDKTGYAEVFIIAGGISATTSLVIAAILGKTTLKLVTAPRFSKGLLQTLISGACLSVWYYSFYRSLFGAQKVDATVIAFSWPLIAVVAMRIFAPSHARNLSRSEWALIITAYLGAIAVGFSGISRVGFLEARELMFAFAAALAAGAYLPFAINAVAVFSTIVGNRILATFYAVSFANIAALVAVSMVMVATDQPLLFYAVDGWVILICALIGIGTYLVAEITWTWALSEYKSLTLSSLAYLSPAFSVILLYLFFDEPIAAVTAFGLALILFSNMTLHGAYQSSNALISALIGTLFIALVSLFIAPVDLPGLRDMLYFISGLFAILAGFILSRVSSRRAQEIDQRTLLVRRIVDAVSPDDVPSRDTADAALRGVIDIEFTASLAAKEKLAEKTRDRLRQGSAPTPIQQEQLLAFDTWLNIHRDRLSLSEKSALWLTGGVSILLLLILRGSDALSTLGLYAFSAGCLLVIFAINDYERNNFQGFRRQMMRLQDGFREIGRDKYLPKSLVDSNEILALFGKGRIRYTDAEDALCVQEINPTKNTFRMVYLGASFLLVCALLTLPISMANNGENDNVLSLRPEVFSDSNWALIGEADTDLRVGVLDWSASKVIAEIIRQTVETELDLRVALVETSVNDLFPAMANPEGDIDIHSDFWAENQRQNLAQFVVQDQLVRLNQIPYAGRQGIYVSAPNFPDFAFTSIADMATPEAIAAFDTDGDGRGEIWIGAAGWQSTTTIANLLDAYGLGTKWEYQTFSDTIFKAKLAQFHQQGKPILFYGYEPDWIHAAYELQGLTIPLTQHQCPAVPGVVTTGTECVFGAVSVHIAFAERLETSHPKAAQLLSAMHFTTEDVNDWLADMRDHDHSPADVAQGWIADNPGRVADWRASMQPTQ